MLGEFGLIHQIQQFFPSGMPGVKLGIGDDAAAVEIASGALSLLTTDALVEHVHFERCFSSFGDIGTKALQVNLSDIAAMGGTPRFFLVSLGLPLDVSQVDVLALYQGLQRASEDAGVDCVGGNVSQTSGPLFISITLTGEVLENEMLTRSNAKTGDALYVTGVLGEAAAGLELLQGEGDQKGFSALLAAQRRPIARLKEARLLATRYLPSAMIDVSDGLAGDLGHILRQSGVGAQLEAAQIPLSKSLKSYAQSNGKDPLGYALSGGEDYELLFTVPDEKCSAMEILISEGQIQATKIGIITDKKNVMQLQYQDGRLETIEAQSFDHLRK